MAHNKYSYALVGLISVLSFMTTACQTEKKAEINYDCSATEVLKSGKVTATPWVMRQAGKSGDISIKFLCKASPFVGDFQECDIQLKYEGKPYFADAIAIDGGMKAHGHGLPTVPTLLPTAKKGHYTVEGLKYSMPGAWTVGFRVSINGVTEQVIFDFII